MKLIELMSVRRLPFKIFPADLTVKNRNAEEVVRISNLHPTVPLTAEEIKSKLHHERFAELTPVQAGL